MAGRGDGEGGLFPEVPDTLEVLRRCRAGLVGGVERLNQRAELLDERSDAVVLSGADGVEDLPEGVFDIGHAGDAGDVRDGAFGCG